MSESSESAATRVFRASKFSLAPILGLAACVSDGYDLYLIERFAKDDRIRESIQQRPSELSGYFGIETRR
jgi:hypothetical protein